MIINIIENIRELCLSMEQLMTMINWCKAVYIILKKDC